MATARGLPSEDDASGILRVTPGGVVKPVTSTASKDIFKVKLQDPDRVSAFVNMEDRTPTRGLGAAKLILPMGAEKKGLLGRKVAMAAAPLRMSADIPKGKAALRRQPSLQTEAEVKRLKTVVEAEATARRKVDEKAEAEATVRRQLEEKLEAEATARRRALPVIRTYTYGHRRCGAAGSREGMANGVHTRKAM